MNVKNYQYIAETLTGLGFGDTFNEELRTKMQLGLEKFSMARDKNNPAGDRVRFAPLIEKSKNDQYSDFYFLNKIKATLHKENGETAVAEFSIFKKSGFTVQEMDNLMIGRAVHREFKNDDGEKVGKWYRLDLNNLDENRMASFISYPDNTARLNLEAQLDSLNIIWKNKDERLGGLQDLRAGERLMGSIREDGTIQRIAVEVAPQMNSLMVFNSENKVIKYTNSDSQSFKAVVEEPSQGKEFKPVEGNVTENAKKVMEAVTNNSTKESKGAKLGRA